MTTPANNPPPPRKTDTPPIQLPGETIDPIPRKPSAKPPASPPDPAPATPGPDIEPGTSTPDEVVDRESEDSFPASDPPSTTPLHAGEPDLTPEPRTAPHEP